MSRQVHRLKRRGHAREQIRRLLSEQALWGQRLPGERELAARLGVCRVTLRRALEQLEREGLVERRHGVGTYAAHRPPGPERHRVARVAVIGQAHYEEVPGWDFRGEMVRGICGLAPRLSAEVDRISLHSDQGAARTRKVTEMKRFDAFISVGLDDHDLLSWLVELDRGPVVLLDGYVRGLPVTTVVDAGFQGMRELTRHLVALGHRRIAFLDCYDRELVNPEKFAGYRAALIDRGIEFDESLVAVPSESDGLYDAPPFGEYDVDDFVNRAVKRLMRIADPPTAIVGFDDGRALPAVRAVEKLGFTVGEDFCVAGFGDQAARRGWSSRLTSSRIYPRKMGQEALRAALSGVGSSPREARTIFVPTRLQIRKSSCPPPGQRGEE